MMKTLVVQIGKSAAFMNAAILDVIRSEIGGPSVLGIRILDVDYDPLRMVFKFKIECERPMTMTLEQVEKIFRGALNTLCFQTHAPAAPRNPCPDCNGSGKYQGFTSVEDCKTCGGTGAGQ